MFDYISLSQNFLWNCYGTHVFVTNEYTKPEVVQQLYHYNDGQMGEKRCLPHGKSILFYYRIIHPNGGSFKVLSAEKKNLKYSPRVNPTAGDLSVS